MLRNLIIGFGFSIVFIFPKVCLSQDLTLFDVWGQRTKNSRMTFVSMADAYPFSIHEDSLVIDPQYIGTIEPNQVLKHEVKNEYRKTFLDRMQLNEKDSIYIINLDYNLVKSYPIAGTPLLAMPNTYMSHSDKFTQYDYYLGFFINDTSIFQSSYGYISLFASVGNRNPFIAGQAKSIAWEPMPRAEFPKVKHARDTNTWYKKYYYPSTAYVFQLEDYTYYLRLFTTDHSAEAYRVLAIERKSDSVLLDIFLADSEGTALSALNIRGSYRNSGGQVWTGKILRGYPPILYGLAGYSFDCPMVYIIGHDAIRLNCDNRH